jgi:hypothetical protein
MKHLAITATALFLLAGSGVALAQTESDGTNNNNTAGGSDSGPRCPEMAPGQNFDGFSKECQNEIDTWAKAQTGAAVVYEGDVAVGTVLPDTVEFIEVPAYRRYGYVMLNDRRVLVDRDTRTVVRVF